MDDQSDKISRLEDRIDQLEATTKKMMPTRRDALKFGGAAAIGAAAMSGTASAGSSQVGTIGDASNLVDIEAEDVNVSDTLTTQTLDSSDIDNSSTLTTQDLVVNGTATGPFGGGGVVLESGDTITVQTISGSSAGTSMQTLYSGSAKDVLGGTISGIDHGDFVYTFSDGTTLHKNGSGTSYIQEYPNQWTSSDGNVFAEVDFLPPALDVTQITVGFDIFSNARWAAEVILKD